MPKTLLLADDSVTIQKVVGISFANEDVVLLTVDNGDDAVARAAEARPDIILADVVMPGKTGYEVCEAIKGNPELSHIPVLLLTGTFEAFDEELARQVGAEGHITKPFEAQALVDQVNELLARAQPAQTPPAPAATPPPEAEPAVTAEPDVAAAMPAGQADDQAYDFFDDDLNEPPATGSAAETVVMAQGMAAEAARAPTVPKLQTEAASTPPAATSGDTTPPARPMGVEARPDPTTLADETVAILPETQADSWPTGDGLGQLDDLDIAGSDAGDDLASADDELGNLDLGSPPDGAAQPGATTPPLQEPGPTPGGLDLGLDPAPPATGAGMDLDAGDLARETLLDPDVARGYDVSSSDLGDSFANPQPQAAQAAADPVPPPTKPVLTDPSEARAARAPAMPAPEPAFSTGPIGEPAPGAAGAPPQPVSAAPDLSPMMRERIHDSLEKVAWEAFGDLSETVARQIVERVEAIAWEVIPQMAEALIQEEIRRLKGEGEE
jgi:CheY-like chemotaxis protein